ncbi:hypothetical protein D3C73_1328500 [compost metagenome]
MACIFLMGSVIDECIDNRYPYETLGTSGYQGHKIIDKVVENRSGLNDTINDKNDAHRKKDGHQDDFDDGQVRVK